MNYLVHFLILILVYLPSLLIGQENNHKQTKTELPFSKNNLGIRYEHKQKESFLSKLFRGYLIITNLENAKNRNTTKAIYYKQKVAAKIPKKLSPYLIDTQIIEGRNIWTFAQDNQPKEKVILYLHGGAFFANILKQHWDLIYALVHTTNAIVIVPDYPLAPEVNYQDIYNFMDKYYAYFQAQYKHATITFMGDSAGGNLAIAYSMYLQENKQKMPQQIIAIAPWLDLNMDNPNIALISKKDRMLNMNTLHIAANIYANNTSLNNYKISPIFGNIEQLPPISIFVGTYDVLYADCIKFKERFEKENIAINFFEYPKMQHVWIAGTILKEAKSAINQIATLIHLLNQ